MGTALLMRAALSSVPEGVKASAAVLKPAKGKGGSASVHLQLPLSRTSETGHQGRLRLAAVRRSCQQVCRYAPVGYHPSMKYWRISTVEPAATGVAMDVPAQQYGDGDARGSFSRRTKFSSIFA
jgi:hypothetical protein